MKENLDSHGVKGSFQTTVEGSIIMENGTMLVRLDGYAVIPREEYEQLIEKYKRRRAGLTAI
jgi:hypothetical protein